MSSQQDGQFGPQLDGQFDFTLLFEHVMLTIVPGGLVVLAIPFYLKMALSEARKVRAGLLLWLKLAMGLALLVIHATSLALWQRASLFRSDIALAAAGMSLVTSLCIIVILYISHTYSIRSSGFLSLFLTITALFDITMTRSYFRRSGLDTIAALQTTVIVLKFGLVILEEVSKRALLRVESLRASVSAETVAGFWNRTVFGWFFSIMIFAFNHDLTLKNLPNIVEDLNVKVQYERFAPKWAKARKTSRYALLFALVSALPWPLLKVIPPRLLFVGLQFSQPFLLFQVVNAVGDDTTSEISSGIVGATALIYLGIALTRVLHEHASYRLLTSIRGILIVAIYDKMQRLPDTKLNELSAVTLMTTDIQGIEKMVDFVYQFFSFIVSWFLGKSMLSARKVWNEDIEARIAATSNILAQIKGVKAMGLSETMLAHLQQQRQKELETSLRERSVRVRLFASIALFLVLPPILVLAGALFWTRVDDPMTIADVFTILTIVTVSSDPFSSLLTSFTFWSGGFASMQRIQDFLRAEEVQDMRVTPAGAIEDDDSNSREKEANASLQARLLTPFAIQFNLVAVTSTVMGPILKNVSFQIPWGSLAIFWGPINCGKSTLLKCILGEVKLESGRITVGTKDIAYCSQDSWLRNTTIRNTVIGVLEFVEDRYREVMTACGLDVDIAALINGDQTLVGSGGCNLSGGQKQRLSMARAAYAQTDIMVVDDVFSALDPDTAQAVFTNLFGRDGLVRRWNCTVIMTTNRLHFLDDADMIFRLYRGGRVQQQENELSDESSADGSVHGGDASRNNEDGNSDSDDDNNSPAAGQTGPQPTLPPSVQPATDNLELRNAKQTRKHGEWSLYRYFLGATNAWALFLFLLSVATSAVAQAMPKIFVRIWYSGHANDHNYFIGYVFVSAGLIMFNSLNGVLFFYFVVPKTSEKLHYEVTKTTLFATLQYLGRTDSGELLNRFSQDISVASQMLPLYVLHFIHIFFNLLVNVGVIASATSYFTPAMIVLLGAIYLIQHFYLRTSRQLRILELESSSALITHFNETTTGIHHVRSFRWQKAFLNQLYEALAKSQRPYYLLFCSQRWLTVTLDLTSAGATILLVLLSLKTRHSPSQASVGLSMLTLVGFTEAASLVIQAWTNLETYLGAVSRIKDFTAGTPTEKDTLEGPEVGIEWPNNGRLDFNCITATYEANDGSTQKALNNVTFTIQPGEKVNVSGRTGSGKSSLFMTILRLADFNGTVSIDGRNSKTIAREMLRQRITTLTQEGLELKGSFRSNIYPFAGTKPSDDEIIAILRSLGLENHVSRHGGLDIDFAAMCFSVSQKQLICLARGILHQQTQHTRIVLIDEATSAMDDDANTELQDLLAEAFAECTVLQISHRENSLQAADVLLKLDAGRVVSLQRFN
ncbi:hypothetical protein NLG97_g2789 [Lecanicillium saksenae]|uniref:Uncharacterized protein n=1 Tax=Lecanicillium saksenae TaxID=468837 RepID=A0ACC1R002_9HYPO|nr:hypothetical protein NLG97_g2789 [Lecanicillium saksenae]